MTIREHLFSPWGGGQFGTKRDPGCARGKGAAGAHARDGRGGQAPLVTRAARLQL